MPRPKRLGLVERVARRERHEHVQAALAAGLDHARQLEQLERAAHRERDLDHLVPPRRAIAGIEIDHRPVGLGRATARREPKP